jgi:hypothetical protein
MEVMIADFSRKLKRQALSGRPAENFLLPFWEDGHIIGSTISSEVTVMNCFALTTASFFSFSYARFMGMGYFAMGK